MLINGILRGGGEGLENKKWLLLLVGLLKGRRPGDLGVPAGKYIILGLMNLRLRSSQADVCLHSFG